MLLSRLTNREYSTSELENELEYALITCPETQKASVSISIEMGHFNDPDDCQGLSHLMEHMLFAGSKRYPDGNHLNQLLNANGGFVNAWTAAQTCNVHFSCPINQFEDSLDVVIDMLTQPKLSVEGISQEIDAIDAEFSMRKQDDVRRLYDVHKQTCNPKHPFSRFSVGNKTIFNRFTETELQQKLRAHHRRYFAAKNIKACIVLPQKGTDNKLIELVETKLSEFATTNITHMTPNSPPLYLPSQQSCLIQVKPYKFAQNLMLTFCLPSITNWYRSKPILILTHLIEDASENTLQHNLKRQGYILDLSASGGIEGDNFQDININLRLTELGLENTNAIIDIMMHWFDFIRQTGIEKWRFEEKSQQLSLMVKHAPLPSGIDEAVLLATRLHTSDLQRALDNDVAMDCFDNDVYDEFLGYFTVSNLRIFCIHPQAKCDQQTNQYEVPFGIQSIDAEKPKSTPLKLLPALKLPPKNPYMSDNFHLAAKELEPTAINTIKSENFLLKFSQNHQFKTPKGDCYLSLENPTMIGSARNSALKKLWVACLSEELSEAYSGAELAGINFRLYGHQGGMTLHTSGFSDRQLMLCEEILRFIQTVAIKPATFLGIKAKVEASLKNTLLNKPINQLFADLNLLMQENTFSQNAILDELKNIDLVELNQQANTYFQTIHIEGLVVGNWSVAQIEAFHASVLECFKDMDKVLKSSRKIAHLSAQKLCIQHRQTHKEHAIVLYFQCASNSNLNRALYIAIEKLLSPIFFDELRNKRNLGYLVGCGYFPVNKRPGLALYIQSPTHTSDALFIEIMQVVQNFVHNIADFEPIFETFKQSLKKQFRVFDANTSQFAQRLWMDFEQLQTSSLNNQMEEAIDTLSFDIFRQGCEQLIGTSSLGTAAFITQSTADVENTFAGFEFIDNPLLFKDIAKYQ